MKREGLLGRSIISVGQEYCLDNKYNTIEDEKHPILKINSLVGSTPLKLIGRLRLLIHHGRLHVECSDSVVLSIVCAC